MQTSVLLYHNPVMQALLSLGSLSVLGTVCSPSLRAVLAHPPRGWRKAIAVQDPLGASYHFLVAVQLRHDAEGANRCEALTFTLNFTLTLTLTLTPNYHPRPHAHPLRDAA